MNKSESFLYTVGEECLNAISHGVGVLLSIAALVLLVTYAVFSGDAIQIVSAAIYGSSLVVLYLSSTLYHSLSRTRANTLFQKFDHISIYLLIAGTYTPVCLCVLKGALGWTIFGLVWGLALFGIVFKAIFGAKYDLVSTGLYVIMGWLILIAAKTLVQNLSTAGLVLFIAGGLFYTIGVYFYIKGDTVKWYHGVWHFFVALGSVSHFLAIFYYVIP